MTSHSKSFDELVNEAPATAHGHTISVVGLLSQASAKDKFVLTVADGQTLTIDRKAVKEHAVWGGSVGQQIVRVDLDPTQLSADTLKLAREVGGFGSGHLPTVQELDIPIPTGQGGYTFAYSDHYFTFGHVDFGLPPYPAGYAAPQGGGAVPFVAAFPRQADPATIAALALLSGPRTYLSAYEWTSDNRAIYSAFAND